MPKDCRITVLPLSLEQGRCPITGDFRAADLLRDTRILPLLNCTHTCRKEAKASDRQGKWYGPTLNLPFIH